MKGLPFVLAFTAMTFIAWGAYGPLLHHGTLSMGNDSLRAFVGVGIAYFFIAVLVPIYILRSQGEAGKWTVTGTFYSLIAGSVGALGALGVILALAYGGAPIYVMPLVFGFAPIVNTLVTAWMSKTFDQISPIFIGGIVVAALGVAGVLAFKPVAPAHTAHPASDSKSDDHREVKSPKKDHTQLDRPSAVRLVSSLVLQEPAQDPLPPVVVQPAPPVTEPPKTEPPKTDAIVPKSEPAQPASPPEQPVAPVAEQQDLPPVVVQPAAPEPTKPESSKPETSKPAAPPTTEAAQEPAPELPPIVVQPAPLQQKDSKAPALTTPPQEAPKVDVPKPEPKPEPTPAPKPEPAAPESIKPEPVKPEPAKPEPDKPDPQKTDAAGPENGKAPAGETVKSSGEAPAELTKPRLKDVQPKTNANSRKSDDSKPAKPTGKATTTPDVPMIILSIIVAAICWGSYGPMLHQGQARMGGSRLRPFTCVGLAYFFIAVAAPLAVIYARTADTGSWSGGGLSWSIIAGAAGAIGALGVILAFNAGGKPYYVMPLVFGFAPVINTCITLTEKGLWGLVTPMFWVSLAVVIAGAITVLLNAPKPKHAKPAT